MSELKPCPMCANEAHCIITGNPCFNTRKSLCDALKKAYERGYRTMIHTERYDDCHIWEPGDKLDTISDSCDVLITAADIKALMQPANEPLTLGQLDGMHDPVWLNCRKEWAFIASVSYEPYAQVWYFNNNGMAKTVLYHHEMFYRRPPGRSENDG